MSNNRVLVVKFGGHAMSDSDGLFAAELKPVIDSGINVVIVHGGGPQISAALSDSGIDSEFIGGFRVTTPEIFEVVERVLSDEVGPSLAKTLITAGVLSFALSGRHSGTLFARRQERLVDGTTANLELVGEISAVDTAAINVLLEKQIVPVISPIAIDVDGEGGLNVNADTAAAAIAGALDSDELIIMTDVAGIYRNWPDHNSLIDSITATELESIKYTFSDGMAPKVQACLDAIKAGANLVRIIDGRDPAAFAEALVQRGGTVVIA